MIKVYDQDVNMLAVLEYADAVSYSLPHNDLWTATFELPKDDPKNAYCQVHNLVSLDDGPRDLGLYRIIGIPDEDVTGPGGYAAYTCEHAAATLLDDLLFGYHEIGGAGVYTADVIRYILDRQEVRRWQLGVCDFHNQFAYKFENDTLLGALMSLGNVLTEPYTWDFDTSTTPWTVNLRRADAAAGCGIYYKRNLQQIRRSVDASTLVTRLYLLGYGEGVNQLTIKDVNGGLPYLDADTISVYGVKKSVFVDRRFEYAESLRARGLALLEGLKIPYTSYTAKAADLVQLTGDAWDEYMPGKIVHVMDGEDGVEFEARIVNIEKKDVQGRRGDIDVTIANSPRDLAESINALADRQGVNDLYSQGATNLYSQQLADNADADHPAVMRVYIPNGCVRINQVLLAWQLEKFRAYETGAEAGGGTTTTTTAGGATRKTSGSGGNSTQTSGSGGDASVTKSQSAKVTVTIGSARSETGSSIISSTGESSMTTGDSSLLTTDSGGSGVVTSTAEDHAHAGPEHRHSFSGSQSLANNHTHSISNPGTSTATGYVSANSTHNVSISGNTGAGGTEDTGAGGAHNHRMGDHTHGMRHTHSVPSHSHSMRHSHDAVAAIEIPSLTFTIPAHTHNVSIPAHEHEVTFDDHSHSLTLGNHTHQIVYGIYEGSKAQSCQIVVDGKAVSVGDASEMDIAPYLATDNSGKITRGAWHEVQIIPSSLSRIEANLFVQTFVQSVGGDY